MSVCNSILRFKHPESGLFLARYVFTYTSDSKFGNMQRLKQLAEGNNMLLTGSSSTAQNSSKKRKALVQSHCMNRRQANLVQVTDVLDINKELGKVVLATSDLVAELVAKNVFTKDQVLDKAINAESLKDMIKDPEELAWDTYISDLELSELFNLSENNDSPKETPPSDTELERVKAENEDLKRKIEDLEQKLIDTQDIRRENERLRSEVADLKSKRGEQLVTADHQYIENALAGKVILTREQVEVSLGEVSTSLNNLKKLVEESTMIE